MSVNLSKTHMPSLAVVGATGAVGREMLLVLEQYNMPLSSLRLFASSKSAGTTLPFRGKPITVEALAPAWYQGIDCALLSAGSSVSKQIAEDAVNAGLILIDNSSAFRMTPGVPLTVPEVNPESISLLKAAVQSQSRSGGIIANPNCSTIILLMALAPIHRAFGVSRAVVSTYQAASGAGSQGMDELLDQTRSVLNGTTPLPKVFAEPYAFNLFSHNSALDPVSGLNAEELKMIHETHKILSDPSVRISATCIRVPVMRAHCESVNITLRSPATLQDIHRVLSQAKGVEVIDDRANNNFPTPLKATGGDNVLVGRLRVDPSQHSPGQSLDTPTLGFDMFIAGDQLRKGAAQNAVQIAQMLYC
jgi:aspartate-semialdehyde dehydrogenase